MLLSTCRTLVSIRYDTVSFNPSARSIWRAKQCIISVYLFTWVELVWCVALRKHMPCLCAQWECEPAFELNLIFIWTVRINRRWINWFLYLLCRKSAPKFLLDVYKQLNDEANGGSGRYARSADSDEGENFITDIDKRAIEQSDIIMTFLNQSKLPEIIPNCTDSK